MWTKCVCTCGCGEFIFFIPTNNKRTRRAAQLRKFSEHLSSPMCVHY